MAIGDFFTGLGQGIGRGLTKIGGYDPMQQVSPEEAARRRQEGLAALQRSLGRSSAILSGDPRRVQFAEQQMQRAEQDKLLQQLAQDPRYAEQIKLLRAGLDPRLVAGTSVERKIIKGADGYNYYVNPDGSFERVLPGIEIPEDKTDMTEAERTQAAYNKLMEIPVEGRSETDKRNIAIYENRLFGQPRVIPFYDSQGNVVESITSRDLITNPNIIKEKEEQGLFTVGQSPSTKPTGAKSVMTLVRDDYLGAKSQIDTINDLASIIEQNKDAFTLAGGLANFVNSTKYQIQSAERLANLDKLQQNQKEFTKLDNMLDSKYGDILDKISQDRAVAKSIFLRLAYGTAKEIDPSGRLSDNDVKIAMDIIGNLGPNWKANLSTLENLANRTQREYADKYKIRINRVGDEDLQEANKYETIPQFLGGRDWRQSMPTIGTQTPPNIQSLLNKYPPQG